MRKISVVQSGERSGGNTARLMKALADKAVDTKSYGSAMLTHSNFKMCQDFRRKFNIDP